MRVVLILVLGSVLATGVWAQNCPIPDSIPAPDAHTLAAEIPEQLIRKGVSNIRSFSLPQLLQEMARVRYCVVDGGFLAGSAAQRTSGVYFRGPKLVNFNRSSWRWVDPMARPVLALHESLGALGYHDEDYEMSLALWYFLVRINAGRSDIDHSSLEEVFDHISRTNDEFTYAEGGITGIGGGGDNVGLEAKMILILGMDRIVSQWRKVKVIARDSPDQLRALVQRSKFESDWSRHDFSTHIQNLGDHLQVRLSALEWNVAGSISPRQRALQLEPVIKALLNF